MLGVLGLVQAMHGRLTPLCHSWRLFVACLLRYRDCRRYARVRVDLRLHGRNSRLYQCSRQPRALHFVGPPTETTHPAGVLRHGLRRGPAHLQAQAQQGRSGQSPCSVLVPAGAAFKSV